MVIDDVESKYLRDILEFFPRISRFFFPVNHVKDEWKAISNECIRVLNRNDELAQTESSIWRFAFALKFMLYAVTQTEEGYVNLFEFELVFTLHS